MQLLDIAAVGANHVYRWPSGNEEPYPHWVEYRAVGVEGEHRVRIGFGTRPVYSQDRRRAVVWIDDRPVYQPSGRAPVTAAWMRIASCMSARSASLV